MKAQEPAGRSGGRGGGAWVGQGIFHGESGCPEKRSGPRSREIAFRSRRMGLGSGLSVVPACRQARVSVTLRLSCSTSPLGQGGWRPRRLHLASIRGHPLPRPRPPRARTDPEPPLSLFSVVVALSAPHPHPRLWFWSTRRSDLIYAAVGAFYAEYSAVTITSCRF